MTRGAELDTLARLLTEITPGPWALWDGCSWRRFGSEMTGREIITPTNQQADGHPDLLIPNRRDADFIVWCRNHAADLLALARVGLVQQWQPIETAPRTGKVHFWIVPKTLEETYTDTSGMPIMSCAPPYIAFCEYGQWSSLAKAIYWLPAPPAPPEAEQ